MVLEIPKDDGPAPKALLFSDDEDGKEANSDGGQDDVVKISRQILNRGTAHRTISKQECMVETSDLPLVLCTEFRPE